ncbi:uncharacterized protein MONOS_251 [Monocercomonoides exilis]|uniref:uncharacterized protein n=1 Tax=Monocercomonoides exilis TaxID=2049356 RepID=UPI0035594C62|nr:hypothetical protein MONOS_251 [Monocercomonoides exilis]|eukprot:MONOS_251.1-p1 / transcript=MONOS_251.1 / gene=MONOS_251 / organism=Monocercomonoides_exilis_PA203 / gene_product=unspecified product / transcript_product=unspecified product / location=Mono_scaffold00004:128974-129783(+) / protein_length=178 / sequence_SO=supercontig / SO=protein_coding / is_pseudo=false
MAAPQPRILIIYFTRTGNSKMICDNLVAEFQKSGINTVTEAVVFNDATPGVGKYWKHVFKSLFGAKYQLDAEPVNDPRQFDIVIFGTPVWSWGLPPPVAEWLKKRNFDITRTTFAAYVQMNAQGAESCIKDIEKLIKAKMSVSIISKSGEFKNRSNIDAKSVEFAANILKAHTEHLQK